MSQINIILLTNSITSTLANNLSKLSINVVATTLKTIKYLVITKQNNILKSEEGVYSTIICNICPKIQRRNPKNLNKVLHEHKKEILQNNT